MEQKMIVERLAYSIDEAAAAISVSRRSVYEYLARGQLTAVKIGGRRLVLKADLEALLAAARGAA